MTSGDTESVLSLELVLHVEERMIAVYRWDVAYNPQILDVGIFGHSRVRCDAADCREDGEARRCAVHCLRSWFALASVVPLPSTATRPLALLLRH